jgi:hypothetical protein
LNHFLYKQPKQFPNPEVSSNVQDTPNAFPLREKITLHLKTICMQDHKKGFKNNGYSGPMIIFEVAAETEVMAAVAEDGEILTEIKTKEKTRSFPDQFLFPLTSAF